MKNLKENSIFLINNEINIAYTHAYSVLSEFSITGDERIVNNCTIIRNPWGTVSFNGSLNAKDSFWIVRTISYVPLGVNPVANGKYYGIFIVP